MKKENTIVADFDKTLTDYDTTLPFARFCAKRTGTQWRLPLFFLLAVFAKLKLVSIKQQKAVLLKWFCPNKITDFENLCFEFSKTIVLNALGKAILKKPNIIIASASLKCYLQHLFPKHHIIASEIKTDSQNRIVGLTTHPMGRTKAEDIKEIGITNIDEFYTDSLNDMPVCQMAKTVHWVKNGQIIKTEHR